ncbi:MAG: hypothetical protein WBK51_06425 [Polaromonas sp.]
MATAKTIAPTATPVEAAPAKTATKTVTAKAVTVKPAVNKQTTTGKTTVKKPAAKKPLSKAFAVPKTAKTAKTAKPVKAEKPKKPKLVRDSFTIPKVEYVVLEALKLRAAKLTRAVKKSELLRAGIKALAALSDAAFLSALEKVPAIKTGRPASAK